VRAAALVGIWRRRRDVFNATNVGGLRNASDACRTPGIPRLVYTSSFLALPPAARKTAIAANDFSGRRPRRVAVALEASRGRCADRCALWPLDTGMRMPVEGAEAIEGAEI